MIKINRYIRGFIRKIKISFLISKVEINHKKKVKLVSTKKVIKIAFFVVNESIWKYDKLYELFEQDERFDPTIFVCPFVQYGEIIMDKEMNQTFDSLKAKGYRVLKTLKEDNTWLDVKSEYKPDIVFFSTPWNCSQPQYQIMNFLDTLTCYVPYGYKSSNLYKQHYNLDMQNLCWKFFLETGIHKKLATKYSFRKGANVIITGAPGMDFLLEKKSNSVSVWKTQEKEKKKIIWAPHHTILGAHRYLNYATFFTYMDFMFELAEKYQDHIQIAFKPHPNLRGKLSKSEIWGKERTDTYYKKWQELPNGQLEEGGYIDLFNQSDAMIHDSGSFLIEYLYTHKPVMFLIDSDNVKEQFNEIGKIALTKLYQGYEREDILRFVNEVILMGQDEKKKEREDFFDEFVRPPHNRTASENIYYHLIEELNIENE